MNLKTLELSVAWILLSILVGWQITPAAAADATGTWLTEDGRARVRTERCGTAGARLCGYIVWASKTTDERGKPILDSQNPETGKRGRPLLGHQMLLGLEPNGKGGFEGKIYNGENGKSYDVKVWSEEDEVLTVEGCMLAVLCGKQKWKRVVDILPGQLQGPIDGDGGPRADSEWAPKATTTSPVGSGLRPKSKAVPPTK